MKNYIKLLNDLWDGRVDLPVSFFIDTSEMENQMMAKWEEDGVSYSEWDNPGDVENNVERELIAPWAEDILNDPCKMLIELGYNDGDFASWVVDQRKNI
jgi:hypothetical protein